eukprot:Skav222127  [mRNA]  locus=scaffold1181:657045:658682:+ [translate_table: standard]
MFSGARKVPDSYHHFEENGHVVDLAYLKPRDMLNHLLSQYPWALLGGLQPGEHQQLLSTFWRNYRKEHPTHAVFEMAANNEVQLQNTIPLVLHGDGGRTTKKQPLEVVSVCPVLGLDTVHGVLRCTCEDHVIYEGKRKRHPLAQRLNLKNTSYATHFLLCAFPLKKFKSTPGILQSMLKAISENLGEVCRQGLSCNHSGSDYHFSFAVLGLKGDQEWHARCGLLNRTYLNVGCANPIPCCSDCGAGGAGVPFEDISEGAAWRATMYSEAPWDSLPPFASIPFANWSHGDASRFFKRDPFHIFRLGIARNFIGSAIVYLCMQGMFDSPGDRRGMDDRLARAFSAFMLWCAGHSVSPASFRSFSRQKLHLSTAGAFPWMGCKASDTILLLRWLRFFTNLQLQSGISTSMLRILAGGCENGLAFQGIYRHGIWLSNSCREKLMKNAHRFLVSYAKLAAEAYQQNLQLWAMVPKFHSFCHIKVDLEPCREKDYYLNPAVWCCSMSEDFIGRVSRQSRRVSYIKVVESTLMAYKVKARFQLKRLQEARGL